MKNIHLLPTDKPSRVYRYNSDLGLAKSFQYGSEVILNQNIYITNDEEIKEGDWSTDGNFIVLKTKTNGHLFEEHFPKKIILTTDQDLITNGVQAIPEYFLELFIEKANDSGKAIDIIETKSHLDSNYFDNGKINYQIIIPKEEPKQETLEEVAKNYANYNEQIHNAIKEAVKFGAKWQQQQNKNLYSEEDMTKYALYILNNTVITPKEWFNQNKKK